MILIDGTAVDGVFRGVQSLKGIGGDDWSSACRCGGVRSLSRHEHEQEHTITSMPNIKLNHYL